MTLILSDCFNNEEKTIDFECIKNQLERKRRGRKFLREITT